MKTKTFKILTITLVLFANIFALNSNGTISGRVVDDATRKPLIGVNVHLENTASGSATDENGNYRIKNIKPGIYNIVFQYMGYKKVMKTDIQIRPDRIITQNASLTETVIQGEEIIVTSGYFSEKEEKTLSSTSFNAEEVRRSPGSAGDVSRILMALPSTAQVYDNANDLMVRGGSPIENGFYIDNIEIPNINHFPTQGSTGGPIGMINVDFVEDVKFNAGGFNSTYGDRLSSVTDIKYREGNQEQLELQLDMSMSGFGGIAEGPLFKGKGNWMLSVRKSYLDLIVDALGTGSAPKYHDIQGKVSYNINEKNKISFLNVYGKSNIGYGKEVAEDTDMPNYGDFVCYQNTAGINWQALWNHKGYSNTSISYSYLNTDDMWYNTDDESDLQGSNSIDGTFRIRNTNTYKFNKKNKVEFGFNSSFFSGDFDNYFNSYTNRLGIEIPEQNIVNEISSVNSGIFVNYTYSFSPSLSVNTGLRADYFTYNKNFHVSPRLSMAYKVNPTLTIKGAFGIYYQNLPIFLLSQSDDYKDLKSPKATHYIIGMDWMLNEDTKFSLEIYNKDYNDFPLNPADPYNFVVDDGRSMSHFDNYPDLVDNGAANSKGIELLLQKKMVKDFYGIVSGTIFHSQYKDNTGKWRDRIYDNKYLFSVVGGYKPNNKWEYSMKWSYAGGIPYTPYNEELSRQYNVGIIDQNQINTERVKDYHSLSVRVDRRFYFKKSTFITYFSVWNAYNRENVAIHYWNEVDNKKDTYNQWSLMPIGGFEWEF